MLKTFLIGLKDLRIAFRDRPALILMLIAPFALTIGLGFVTGRFSGGGSGISDIPVILVNLDNDRLGDALVEVFNSEDLAELVEPVASPDPEAARRSVDEDQAAAAIIIPEGFSESIIPQGESLANPNSAPAETVKIEVYANPSRRTSAGIIKAIVDEFASRVEEDRLSNTVSILQLLYSGRIAPGQVEAIAERVQSASPDDELAIRLNSSTLGGQGIEFDALAYIAPGMALMFLMYTVSYGGRSILAERALGTLPRLLVSPSSSTQILGGKILGIFLTGAAQMLILIGASTLIFKVEWGDGLGVLMLVLAAVFGATGWGMLITALSRTPAQVGTVGAATMMIFAIMGGSFISLENMPPFVLAFSKITPNAWALDGFTTLGLGGTTADLSTPITALLSMGLILFVISVVLFGRKNLVQR